MAEQVAMTPKVHLCGLHVDNMGEGTKQSKIAED